MQLDPNFRWFKLKAIDNKLKECYYIFRGITTKELRIAGTKSDKFAAEEYILSCSVLGEYDWENMLAGVTNTLLAEIYKISGLTEESLTFTIAADWISSETGALEAAAVSMISGLTLEQLDNCCPTNYAKYLLMGKYQFENMYKIPIEEAFGINTGSSRTSTSETVIAQDALGRDVAKQSRTTFEWKQGQTIEIAPQPGEIILDPEF